jgi:pilus assembly protein CpaB
MPTRSPPWPIPAWSPPAAWLPGRRRWSRRVRRHRRGLTAGLAGVCLIASLQAAAPARPSLVAVLVAARDLPGGGPLSAADLTLTRLPPSAVPSGALRAAGEAVGRTLAAPVRRGEPLTDVRLVGPRLVDALGPGLVATPVRLADPALASLLRPGDRVDVLAAPADPAAATHTTVAAADVQVLAVPVPDTGDETAAAVDGALVVLATTPRIATVLAGASAADRLSVTLLGG